MISADDAALVSIILPTYNGERFLERAIESCLSQTYARLEVIIVDDGSTDGTPAIVAKAMTRDDRVRVIKHQTNAKLPAALNTGHRAARGEYLTWTSDDNWYDPDAIEVMVRHLELHRDAGLAYCGYRQVAEDGSLIRIQDFPDASSIHTDCVVGACFLYRREVYEAIGEYDPDAFLAEDWDYWLRVDKRYRFTHVPSKTPYNYTCHAGSLTETRRPEVALQAARVAAKHCTSRVKARRLLSSGHFDAHWCHRVSGNRKQAIKHLLLAIANWPLSPKAYRSLIATMISPTSS